MQEITVDKIECTDSLPCQVLHKSGVMLWRKNESICDATIAAIKSTDTPSVFFMDPDDDPSEEIKKLTYTTVPISSIKIGTVLASPIYDQEGQLLFEAERPLPESLPQALARRGIEDVLIQKSQEELATNTGKALRKKISNILKQATEEVTEVKVAAVAKAPPPKTSVEAIEKEADETLKAAYEDEEVSFASIAKSSSKERTATEEEKSFCCDKVLNCREIVRNLFSQVAGGSRHITIEPIEEIADSLMKGLLQSRDILMYITASKNDQSDYLIDHSLATAIMAGNICASLDFDATKVKLLVYSGLLADIGMLKVPEDIRNKPGQLTGAQYAEIRRHPAYGMDLLQPIKNLPKEVPYIIYQTHERANGSGYPNQKTGVVIHPCAQIVSIADIYSSVIAQRPHRPALKPYQAMEKLVMMCGKKIINPKYVKAFLRCNSMFPIGSYVKLSNDKIARVIATNDDNFTNPYVALIFDAEGKKLEQPERVNLLEREKLNVLQALMDTELPSEVSPLEGF